MWTHQQHFIELVLFIKEDSGFKTTADDSINLKSNKSCSLLFFRNMNIAFIILLLNNTSTPSFHFKTGGITTRLTTNELIMKWDYAPQKNWSVFLFDNLHVHELVFTSDEKKLWQLPFMILKKQHSYLKKDRSKPTHVVKIHAMKPYWKYKSQNRNGNEIWYCNWNFNMNWNYNQRK